MERHVFIILAFLLSLMDIAYTFTNVSILKKHKAKWEDTEYNPLVRSSWHLFGLLNGTLFAGAVTLAAIVILAYIIGNNEFFQGVLIGMFLMIHHLHYVNYAYISRKYLKKDLPWIGRIIMEW
jgi:hypothetical protein